MLKLLISAAALTTLLVQAQPQPVLHDVSPHTGSVLGGTRVTIDGVHFGDHANEITVQFGNSQGATPCEIVHYHTSDSLIICDTWPSDLRGDLNVQVAIAGVVAKISDTCRTCKFKFTEDATPTVTRLGGDVVAGPSTITAYGDFGAVGDTSPAHRDFNFFIGPEQRCDLGDNEFTKSTFSCDVRPQVPAGDHDVEIVLRKSGKARGEADVLVLPSIRSISPQSGSVAGGQLATISGSGFPADISKLAVSIHGAPCSIEESLGDRVVCRTGPNGATQSQTTAPVVGSAFAEFWSDLPSGTVFTGLLSSSAYFQPTSSKTVSRFGGSLPFPNSGYQAVRITTHFVPTETGEYTFEVSADDYGELWLSSDSTAVAYEKTGLDDEDTFNTARIAWTGGHTSSSEYDKYTSQKSEPVQLTAGSSYWMRGYVKNNGGGVHFNIRVTSPSGQVVVNPSGSLISYTAPEAAAVSVTVDSVDAICVKECLTGAASYAYEGTSTATVSAINPTSVSSGTVATISGTGFNVEGDNVVTAGGALCIPSSSTATQIVCTFKSAPTGTADLMVNVGSNGYAIATNIQVTGLLTVTSVSPTIGSVQGGTEITLSGTGFPSDASLLTVTVGSSACTVNSVTSTQITCTTAANTAGASTATVALKSGETFTLDAAVPVAPTVAVPGLSTTVTSRLYPKTGPVAGGTTLKIRLAGKNFRQPSDATVALVQTGGASAPCEVYFALASRILCRTPPHAPATVQVQVTPAGESTAITVASFTFRETVQRLHSGYLGPNGGNYFAIEASLYGQADLNNIAVSVDGAPCAALRWDSNRIGCYPAAQQQKTLTSLLTVPFSASSSLENFNHDDSVRFSAADSAVFIPAGSFLSTKTSFPRPIVFRAKVKATKADSCVYMRAFNRDPASTGSGYVGFAGGKDGAMGYGTSGTSGWKPTQAKESDEDITKAGVNAGSFVEWKMEVRNSGIRFFINGELVGTESSTRSIRSGPVGFGFSCQDILVKDLIVEDLTPMSLQITHNGNAVYNEFDVSYPRTSSWTVNSLNRNTGVKGGASVLFTLSKRVSTWPISVYASAGSAATSVDQLPRFCTSIGYIDDSGSNLRCTVNADLPAGSYVVQFRDYYLGFHKETFTVSIVPSIQSVTPDALASAVGGQVVVTGRNLPSSGATVTVGGAACTIDQITTTKAFCTVGALSGSGAQEVQLNFGGSAIGCDEGSCSISGDADAPTITSISPNPIVSAATRITISGTNLGRGSTTIGGAVCSYHTASSTRYYCYLTEMPSRGGSQTVTIKVPSTATSTVSVNLDSPSLASSASVGTGAGASLALNGFFTADGTTSVSDESFTASGSTTSWSGISPRVLTSCENPIGRFLGGVSSSGISQAFTNIAAHQSISVNLVAAVLDSSSTAFRVTIDGTRYTVYGRRRCTRASVCGNSNSNECLVTVSLTVPHSAATANIAMDLVESRTWGIRTISVKTGGAIPYAVFVGGAAATVTSVDATTIRYTAPAVSAGSQDITVTKSNAPLTCTGCSLTVSADANPSATSYIGTTAQGVWMANAGIVQSANSLMSASGPSSGWRGAVGVQSYAANAFQSVSFKFGGLSGCKTFFGLVGGRSTTGSYTDIDFSIYYDRGNVQVWESGRYIRGLASGSGSTFGIQCGDASCSSLQYTVDGRVLYRSTTAPTFPLRLDSSFYYNDCSVTDITVTQPTGAPAAPAALFLTGNFPGSVTSVTVGGSACAVAGHTSSVLACSIAALPTGSAAVVFASTNGAGSSTATAATSVLFSASTSSGSTAGGQVLQLRGINIASAATSFTICNPTTIVTGADGNTISCVTAAGTAGDVTIEAAGVTCAGTSCPTYEYSASSLSITSFSTTTIADGTEVLVMGSGFGWTTRLQLSADYSCTTIEYFSGNFTARCNKPPAGQFQAQVVNAAGFSSSSAVAVSVALSVASTSRTAFGTLGGGSLRVTGSGFSSTATQIVDGAGASLCSSITVTYATISCTVKAGAVSGPFTVKSNGQQATLAITVAASSNPVVTAISPATARQGDVLTLTGSGLDSAVTLTIGSSGATCQGVSASSATSATCVVRGSIPNAATATIVSSAAGAGTSSATVSGKFGLTSASLSGTTLTVQASGLNTANTYSVLVGDNACTDTPVVTATAISCTVSIPGSSVGRQLPVTVGNVAGAPSASTPFTFSTSATPTVTAISPTTGVAYGGEEVTITGTGFNLDFQQNEVQIGGSRCLVSEATATELKCNTESHAPAANQAVEVNVLGSGKATSSATFSYQFSVTGMTIDGISTTSSSLEGGAALKLTGVSLPAAKGGDLKVTVNGRTCEITTVDATGITCTIPQAKRNNNFPEIVPGTVPNILRNSYSAPPASAGPIRVSMKGSTAAIDDNTVFVNYLDASTPKITSISPAADSTVQDGASITITGSGFAATGNKVESVSVNNGRSATCTITQESATQITCTLAAAGFGVNFFVVTVPGKGAATAIRSCPAGSFLMCDGACLTDADCKRADWGRTAGCNDLMELIFAETYCHAKGGTDRINQKMRLDNGKAFDSNCPFYDCEGGDCDKVLTYAGRSARFSTCGKDPIGLSLNVLPTVTAVTGGKASGLLGGLKLTLTGTGFSFATTVMIGDTRCRTVSVQGSTTYICETGAREETDPTAPLTMVVSRDGAVAPCTPATICEGFSYVTDITPEITDLTRDSSSSNQELTFTGARLSSDVEVFVGSQSCTLVGTPTATEIKCAAPNLPLYQSVSEYALRVRVAGVGYASFRSSSDSKLRYYPRVVDISPASGSKAGGTTTTITGYAFSFVKDNYAVTICGRSAEVISASATNVVVKTPACSSSSSTPSIKIFGLTASCIATSSQTCSFSYDTDKTPSVSSISPNTLVAGSAATFTGDFKTSTQSDVTATVGGAACPITAFSSTSLTCTIPANGAAGEYPVAILVKGLGYTSGLSSATVTYALSVSTIAPTSGSLGGYQLVTISGTGFATETDAQPNVTVAGNKCSIETITNVQILCRTGAVSSATSGTASVEQGESTKTTTNSYSYDPALTSTVSTISPNRGSTAGGTILTITGSGLTTSQRVTISGVECVQSAAQQSQTNAASGTALYCTTGAHQTELTFSTFVIETASNGNAAFAPGATYQYVDLWSRRTTWNNEPPPRLGESVTIPTGQTVMMDVSPPKLILIIVQGHLVFDDTKDITLECQYVVVHRGKFTIGTEEKPYTKRAIIRLFGDRLTPEIPASGAKSVVVYQGDLDWHGIKRDTWTRLHETALPGSDSITVHGLVDWAAGEEIVVGATNFEMLESEPRHITTVTQNTAAGTTTVGLSRPLRWHHHGVKQCFSNTDGDEACVNEIGQVMLLSRNILFTGDDDSYRNTFGATTMLRPMGIGKIRIKYVEFTKVGQRFMLGRYPVHFHMTGDEPNSYVIGTAVHRSMNRAFTIHGVNKNLYRHNVVYDTEGHSFFFEDGTEQEVTLEENCVFVTRTSTSNLNSDMSPANYWVTHANNYLRRNVAGGSAFYGFWWSPVTNHPSRSCPIYAELGEFLDNEAHSNGNYGLQLKPNWSPRKGGECKGEHSPQVMEGFFSWKNHIHGINLMNSGSVSFSNLTIADIGTTDIESSLVWDETVSAANYSHGVWSGQFFAYTANRPYHRGAVRRGYNMPRSDNFFVHDVTFVNFENENWALDPFRRQKRMSLNYEWGWEYVSSGLKFINSPQRLRYRFHHNSIQNDLDGTLSGVPGGQIVPLSPFFDNGNCTALKIAQRTWVPLVVCNPDYKIRRIGVATSERGGDQLWWIHGVSEMVYRLKGKYCVTVPINHEVDMQFQEGEGPDTMSSQLNPRYMPDEGEKILIRDWRREDRWSVNVTFDGRQPAMDEVPPILEDSKSAWHYDRNLNGVHYLVARPSHRWTVNAYRCPPTGCLAPGGPAPVEGPCKPWGEAASWASGVVPASEADVTVTYQDNLCLDNSIDTWPVLRIGQLMHEGTTTFKDEFCPTDGSVVKIIIDKWAHIRNGRFRIGNETHKIKSCKVEIIIGGPNYDVIEDVRAHSLGLWGSRAFALEYGEISIHGEPEANPVVHLSAPATAGSSTLTVDTTTNWAVGSTIVIGGTNPSPQFTQAKSYKQQSEKRRITAISGNTITLDSPLSYSHDGTAPQLLNGVSYNIGAEVAILDRMVTMHGNHAPDAEIQYNMGWQFAIGCTPEVHEGCAGGSVDENGWPMSHLRPGVVRVQGVEFRDIGQLGKRHGAIEADGLRGASGNYISHSSVHRTFAVAISLRHLSEPMTISDNTIYDFYGEAVRVASKHNTIDRNTAMLQQPPLAFCAKVYQPMTAECWTPFFRIAQSNTLRNNLAVAGGGIGYTTSGTDCDDNKNYWSGNIARNLRDGAHVLNGGHMRDYYFPAENFNCRRVEGITAFSIADNGVALWFPDGNFTVSNIVSVNNRVGFSAIVVQKDDKEVSLELSNSAFAARWKDGSCDGQAFKCRFTKVSDEPWCRTHLNQGERVEKMGVLETIFVTKEVGRTLGESPYFMWQEGDAYAPRKAKASYRNIHFENWNGATSCGTRESAFFQNPFHNDTFAQHTFSGITWDQATVINGGKFWAKPTYGDIANHMTHGFPHATQTVYLDFDNPIFGAFWADAPNKIWVVDQDGSFLGTGTRSHLLSSQSITRESTWNSMGKFNGIQDKGVASIGPVRDGCTFQPDNNVFSCEDKFEWVTLVVESVANDALQRRVAPLVLCKGDGMTVANGDPICQDGIVDFASGPTAHSKGHRGLQFRVPRFQFVVENKGNYTLHYRGSPPAAYKIWLTNYEWTGKDPSEIGIVINTRVYGANSHNRMSVAIDGRKERPVFGFGYPYEFGKQWPAPLDRPGTHYMDKYIIPTFHRNVMSLTVRPEVETHLFHERIIQINMDIAIPMSEFWDRSDAFAISLAAALNIPEDTMRWVSVVPGSSRRRRQNGEQSAVGGAIDGGQTSELSKKDAQDIKTRAADLSNERLTQIFAGYAVSNFQVEILEVTYPYQPITVTDGTLYFEFNVTMDNADKTFDNQAVWDMFVDFHRTNGTYLDHNTTTSTETIFLANYYEYVEPNVHRFTITYAYPEDESDEAARNDLLALLRDDSRNNDAWLMPSGYKIDAWRYHQNGYTDIADATASSNGDGNDSGLSKSAVAGLVSGVVIGILLVAAVGTFAIFMMVKRKEGEKKSRKKAVSPRSSPRPFPVEPNADGEMEEGEAGGAGGECFAVEPMEIKSPKSPRSQAPTHRLSAIQIELEMSRRSEQSTYSRRESRRSSNLLSPNSKDTRQRGSGVYSPEPFDDNNQ